MTLGLRGVNRVLRGVREADRAGILVGFALIVWALVRKQEHRKLLYRKTLPVGSGIVVRHRHPTPPGGTSDS